LTLILAVYNGKSNMSGKKDDIALSIHEEHANLQHSRSAGAFTISPELFEKVRTPPSIHWYMILIATSYI
jgi:hypothetical protein